MRLFKYDNWLSNRDFLVVIWAIVSCRLSAIVILDNINIFNDSGLPIKFGGAPAFLDYILYKNHIANPWSEKALGSPANLSNSGFMFMMRRRLP